MATQNKVIIYGKYFHKTSAMNRLIVSNHIYQEMTSFYFYFCLLITNRHKLSIVPLLHGNYFLSDQI